jgi:predicted LPLAT superfamily acyltransferase
MLPNKLLKAYLGAAFVVLILVVASGAIVVALRAPLQWFNFYDFWHLPALDTPDAFR